MEPQSDTQARASWQAVFGETIRDRDYRAILVEMLLVGLGVGLTFPYVSLWVTEVLGGTTVQAAFLFVPFGIVGSLVSIGAGAYSDRVSRRKEFIVATLLVGGVARLGLAHVRSYSLAVVLFAMTGISPFALVFALLGDHIAGKRATIAAAGDAGAFITTIERTAYSLGWLLGPVVGGFVIGAVGYSAVFDISGALFLLASLWSWIELKDRPHRQSATAALRWRLHGREIIVLVLIFTLGLLLLAGDSGRGLFLSLYLTRSLHLGVQEVSWAFSITVLAELLFIPVAGRMADRFGVRVVLIVGIATQALYFIGLSFARVGWAVLVLQVAYALVVATSSGVAIVFAQRTMPPERGGLTSSTYLVSRGVAPLLNSLLVGSAFIGAHLGRVFLALGILACGALVIVFVITRLQERAGATAD